MYECCCSQGRVLNFHLFLFFVFLDGMRWTLTSHLLQVLLGQWETNGFDDVMKINIRLHNYPESSISLKNLRAAYIGRPLSHSSE